MLFRSINLLFNGGSPNIPLCSDDKLYAQDYIRDFRFHQDAYGQILQDICNNQSPIIISGGVISAGTPSATTISITPFVGYAPYSVNIPNSFSSLPPTVMSADVSLKRITMPQQTNIVCTTYGATLDGSTNYVCVSYAEANGNSRNYAFGVGSYNYELVPSYTLTISKSAPTSYQVCLGTIAGNGSGALTITINNRNIYNPILSISYNKLILSQFVNQTAAEANDWISVCWSPALSLFCAVSDNGTHQVMTSPDGITWTPRTAAEANEWYSVCWSPALSLFCAIAPNGTHRVMTNSANLINTMIE